MLLWRSSWLPVSARRFLPVHKTLPASYELALVLGKLGSEQKYTYGKLILILLLLFIWNSSLTPGHLSLFCFCWIWQSYSEGTPWTEAWRNKLGRSISNLGNAVVTHRCGLGVITGATVAVATEKGSINSMGRMRTQSNRSQWRT